MCLTNDGTLDEPPELRDELVSVALGLHGVDLEKCKSRLLRLRLIGPDWKPCNWERRQESSDPKAAERMRRFREALEAKRNVTRNVTDKLRIEGEVEVEEEYTSPKGDVRVLRKRRPPVPFAEIVDLYHQCLPELPRVEKLTKTREGYIRQRWQEDLTDLSHWRHYFDFVRQSAFLMGRSKPSNGKPPFRADLEWITRPNNYAKIAEEKYHG